MSPMPALSPVAATLYEQVSPLAFADPDNGYAVAHVCQAIGLMWQDMDDLIRDTDSGPGWSTLVDVNRAPGFVLPWLAQLAGVRATRGISETALRDEVARADGQRRGTPEAIRRAAAKTLTGTQSVRLVERTTSAYTLTVITSTSETPDPAATLAALLAAKPAGLVLTHVVSSAPVIDEGTLSIDAATGDIDTATIADIT